MSDDQPDGDGGQEIGGHDDSQLSMAVLVAIVVVALLVVLPFVVLALVP